MKPNFDLQGHRGARGLRPENTLPAFEAALDLQVSSLETDLQRTRDGMLVLAHDPMLNDAMFRILDNAAVPAPAKAPLISKLTSAELRSYVADGNPDAARYPKQKNDVTPVAEAFAKRRRTHPYGIPTLDDLLAFVSAYAGEPGKGAGKTDEQRARARAVRFNVELKRVPFRPELIGDGYDGSGPAEMERQLVDALRQAGVVERTTVQCFDHRVIRHLRKLEPKLTGAILILNTAPASIGELAAAADAQVYSPDYRFLDAPQVRQAHEAKVRVVPFTVNEPEEMQRLLDWEVDGIITDYPDRLIPLLQTKHLRW